MSSIWTVRRSASDSKIAGLCGGIAAQWGVDAVLVRVGFVLLALSGGIGVVLYLAGWLMIPLADQTRSHLDDAVPQSRHWPREVKVVVVAIACILGAVLLAPVLPFGIGSALVLAAIWYFGYYQHRRPNPADHPDRASNTLSGSGPEAAPAHQPQYQYFTFADPSTPFAEAATAWQQRMREHQNGRAGQPHPAPRPYPAARESAAYRARDHDAYLTSADPVGLYHPVIRPASRALSRPARRLRLGAVLVLGLTVSGLALASAAGAHVGLTTYLAAALTVAGLTLVAAAWIGRARGILPIALLLAVATVFSAVLGNGTGRAAAEQSDGVGIHSVSYSSPATLPAAEEWDSGKLTVDLSGLTLNRDTEFTAHVDQGSLTLIAPRGARIQVDSSIDNGYLKLGDTEGRWGSELTRSATYGPASGPLLTVHASVDDGVLEVRQ